MLVSTEGVSRLEENVSTYQGIQLLLLLRQKKRQMYFNYELMFTFISSWEFRCVRLIQSVLIAISSIQKKILLIS